MLFRYRIFRHHKENGPPDVAGIFKIDLSLGGLAMSSLNSNIPEQVLEIKGLRQGQLELLQGRLGLLSGKDKVLMTMYFVNGNSFRQIARLRGVSETSIARRIHQIAQRLTDGEFLLCVRNRDKLNRRQMAVARDYFLTGLSIKQIAERKNMSLYAVRKVLFSIRHLLREMEPVSSSC